MTTDRIIFDDVSKFYGEVLGVNRVTLSLPPGITSLVGPNGSGKTTLMNLMTGLIHPTEGEIRVLGIPPDHPEQLCRIAGYCTQFDAFPKGLTGYQFIHSLLRMYGMGDAECDRRTRASLEMVEVLGVVGSPLKKAKAKPAAGKEQIGLFDDAEPRT